MKGKHNIAPQADRPSRLRRIGWRQIGSILLTTLAVASSVLAEHTSPEGTVIGRDTRPSITLYIAKTQWTRRAPEDKRIDALTAWLTHVADQADVNFVLRPVSVERWQAQLVNEPDSCALANARLPERERTANWLLPVFSDSLVIISKADDPFQGDLDTLLRQADGTIAAASGIYRQLLAQHGTGYIPVDDQAAIIQMINAGRIRFGLISGNLAHAQMEPNPVRIVGKLTDTEFWFSCSRLMATSRTAQLRKALAMDSSERLRQAFLTSQTSHPAD